MDERVPGTAVAISPGPLASRPAGWRWAVRLIGILFGLLVGGEAVRVVLISNFHEVIPGELYRRSQPKPHDIEHLVRDYGIRTIVNLRGRNDTFPWYEDEARACQSLGIAMENVTFSVTRLPSKHELNRLIEILDHAPRPILLHCRQGADRTGLATAVAMLLTPGITYSDARSRMGLRYGHWHLGPAGELSKFFDRYKHWLDDESERHSSERFRQWASEHYRGNSYEYDAIECVPLQKVIRAGQPFGYRVTLRNSSDRSWSFRAQTRAGHHLAYVIHDQSGRGTVGRAGLLDQTVSPGESIAVTVQMTGLAAGRYRVRFDMVEEPGLYFWQMGQEPIEEELIVHE